MMYLRTKNMLSITNMAAEKMVIKNNISVALEITCISPSFSHSVRITARHQARASSDDNVPHIIVPFFAIHLTLEVLRLGLLLYQSEWQVVDPCVECAIHPYSSSRNRSPLFDPITHVSGIV